MATLHHVLRDSRMFETPSPSPVADDASCTPINAGAADYFGRSGACVRP